MYVLCRMCGYVILKLREAIKCGGCYRALLEGDTQAASVVSTFVKRTDYVEGAQVRVTVEVFLLLCAVERVMWHSTRELSMCSDSITELLCAHFSTILAEYTLTTCHDVKNKVVRRYVSMRLRQLSNALTLEYSQRTSNSVPFSSRTVGGGVHTSVFQPSRRAAN